LDDFYSLQLDKMDRYVCLKKSEVVIAENDGSSSSGDDSDSNIDEEDEDDEQEEEDSESGATSQDHAEAEKSAQHLEHSGVDDVIAEAGQDELAAVVRSSCSLSAKWNHGISPFHTENAPRTGDCVLGSIKG
jgi:hypothetical protein